MIYKYFSLFASFHSLNSLSKSKSINFFLLKIIITLLRYTSHSILLPRWHSGKESACWCGRSKRTQVQSLGLEGHLERETAIHSSILAWKIPWTEEPGGLQSMESQRAGHDRVTEHTHTHHTIPLQCTAQRYLEIHRYVQICRTFSSPHPH